MIPTKSTTFIFGWPATLTATLALIGIVCYLQSWSGLQLLLILSACCILVGKALGEPNDGMHVDHLPKAVRQIMNISRDPKLAELHARISDSLTQMSELKDPIFNRLARQRLSKIAEQVEQIARAEIEFPSTESWRVAYEELLRSPGLHLYRSIAYIETPHYWQDGPGQQSTRLNLELQAERALSIERTAIIADHLWPEFQMFPVDPLHSWLEEQHRHGIWIRLVRESEVVSEPELLTDCGIYGSRAVGIQLADPAGRTIRFVLSFDFEKVKQAEALWERLAVFSISYRDLLDQAH